ncbi:MAG: PepSY-like domain-containing protein [Paludibacteraceae bacterium]|nr:PepSY-like domain-containing protein [Paludibacteraceae bacterium]
MKRNLFLTFMVVFSVCFISCAKEQIITIDKLPAEAQSIIQTHFAGEQVSYVMQEREGLSTEYEVRFAAGSKLEFDSKGALKKVDCEKNPVPQLLIPESVRTYVQTNFPNAFITEWGKDDRYWKAELNNGLELEFNKEFKFVRVDD